jgi:hypothetical protein
MSLEDVIAQTVEKAVVKAVSTVSKVNNYPLWLTSEQACELSGLPLYVLEAAANDGEIQMIKTSDKSKSHKRFNKESLVLWKGVS